MNDENYRPITLEAHGLVFGDRNATYGHPLDDFTCTAACWTAYLKHKTRRAARAWKGDPGELRRFLEIFDQVFSAEAEDVGPMMIHVKLSRQANHRQRDNMRDTAGYAETTEWTIDERARRQMPPREVTHCVTPGNTEVTKSVTPGAPLTEIVTSAPLRIYIAGPYSAASEQERLSNTRRAMAAAVGVMQRGHTFFCPHTSHYVDQMAHGCDITFLWETWMDWCQTWLRQCDALFYLGPSKGADMELAWAQEWGLPIFRGWDEIPRVARVAPILQSEPPGRDPGSPPSD